jgi:hypothetical protein
MTIVAGSPGCLELSASLDKKAATDMVNASLMVASAVGRHAHRHAAEDGERKARRQQATHFT